MFRTSVGVLGVVFFHSLFTPDTRGRVSRSSSVVTTKSPGQDITSLPFSVGYPHDRNGSRTGLCRCADFFNFACVLLTSSGQVSWSWATFFNPYSSLSRELWTAADTCSYSHHGSRLVHERRSDVFFAALDGSCRLSKARLPLQDPGSSPGSSGPMDQS